MKNANPAILNKETLVKEFQAAWETERMVKHCVNKTCIGFIVRDTVVIIDKESIKTQFGFGYECFRNVDTSDKASELAQQARTDIKMFVNSNLQKHDDLLKLIDDALIGKEKFVIKQGLYSGQQAECRLGYIELMRSHKDYDVSRIMTNEELSLYREMVSLSREKLLKRVQTYLKKYGLSKVETLVYDRNM